MSTNAEKIAAPNFVWMHEVCHYDPVKDISPVVASDVINIAQAFVDGVIPDNVVAPDTEYDGIDDPRKIFGRPSNEFEAIHMLESVKAAEASVKSATKDKNQ